MHFFFVVPLFNPRIYNKWNIIFNKLQIIKAINDYKNEIILWKIYITVKYSVAKILNEKSVVRIEVTHVIVYWQFFFVFVFSRSKNPRQYQWSITSRLQFATLGIYIYIYISIAPEICGNYIGERSLESRISQYLSRWNGIMSVTKYSMEIQIITSPKSFLRGKSYENHSYSIRAQILMSD